MADLPRPIVTVTPSIERDSAAPSGSVDIVITRADGVGKDGAPLSPKVLASHRADGGSVCEVVKDAVTKVIGDRRTGEALP